ncbi:MAG: MFS transporter [Planctomycetota bacterium]
MNRDRPTNTAASGTIGNVLEWYDFTVFGFLAPQISGQFFPASDAHSGLLKTFGVFAIGYLARPVGGLLFGQIGDRFGRTRALQLSVAAMAVPTSLIMVLPTYAQVGLLSPLLLLVLRLVQGISAGGEFVGSSTYLVEIAERHHRTASGSWTMSGAVLGLLLGSGAAACTRYLLTPDQFATWGWRAPFLGGMLIGIVGWQMRRSLQEPADFERLQATSGTEAWPVAQVLREMPWRIAQVVGISLLLGVGVYTLFVWMPTYLVTFVRPPVTHALVINTAAMTLLLILTPLAGWLGDQVGYRNLFAVGSFGMALTAVPLFGLMESGSAASVGIVMAAFAVLMASIEGTLAVAMAECFPARVRYSGSAIAYNLMFALFGGTTPLVATWLVRKTGSLTAPAWYVTIAALISFLCALSLPRRHSALAQRDTTW